MKKLLLVILLFVINNAFAQNWNCIKPGEKKYFTNSSNYLRGIRIDSIAVSGTDTIYYPFRTTRLYLYQNNLGNLPFFNGTWVGNSIIKHIDGTFVFNTYLDSIVLKSQAQLGDSWIFNTDTLGTYFKATVTSVDTMTVLGSLDSIKVFTLTAHDTTNTQKASIINGLQIIIGKNNGFVSLPELFLFPYRQPGSIAYRNIAETYFYETGMSTFTLINYIDPVGLAIYNYHLGDFLEFDGVQATTVQTTTADVIISVDSMANSKTYTIDETGEEIHYDQYGNKVYNKTARTYKLFADSSFVLGGLMPEEKYLTYSYYNPFDSSFCMPGALYKDVDAYFPYLGGQPFEKKYKVGIGCLTNMVQTGGGPIIINSSYLDAYYISGNLCGPFYWPEKVQEVKAAQIDIYPNPANESITIKTDDAIDKLITISDILGHKVKEVISDKAVTNISTADIVNGIYFVGITQNGQLLKTGKVVIQH